MRFWTTTIASLAIVGTLTSPAFAQGGAEGTTFADETVMMVRPSGQIVRRQVADAAMSEMMMKDARPMAVDTILMMHGGKMYVVTDKRMSDGKMISERIMTTQ
jgi:hypothetical protein